MAYNPFDFFRKHQKVLFAVVTVIIMFVFVLQAGVSNGGDFFQSFPRWVAKFQTHGEVMAKIDGSTVKKSQLDDLGHERGVANVYMLAANAKSLEALKSKAKKEAAAATTKEFREQLDGDVQMVDRFVSAGRLPAEVWPQLRARVAKLAFDLEGQQTSTPKQADKDRVQAVRVYALAAVGEMNRRMTGDRGESGVYFANQPNRTDRDRLEFLLWKKKADQLGIRYTHDDVIKLVDAEFPAGSITPDDLKAMATDSAKGRRANELYDALADEFRVRAAQMAVMGVNPVRFPAAPPAGTAEERYEHFVKETITTKYTFFTIPVEAYLAEVDKKLASKEWAGPTDAELTKIFNEASTTDPDPGNYRPGVREPRKVGVQWVEVSGEEDYYKDLAAKRVQAIPQVQAVFGPTLASVAREYHTFGYDDYLAEQGRMAAFRQSGKAANPGRPVLANFARGMLGGGMMMDDTGYMLGQPAVSNPQDGLTDAEFVRPELAAALAGLTASALATNAPPFAPIAAVTESAFRQTREQRVVAGIQAFLVPTLDDGPGRLAEVIGAAVATHASTPPPLSPAAVQTLLDRRTGEALRTEVASEDLRAFQKELTRITGQKLEGAKLADKGAQEKAERDHKAKLTADAKKYADEWIAARKLKTGGTTEPRSVHTLAEDSGLVPLLQKDFMLTDTSSKPRNSRAATSFGQAFVTEMELGQSPEGGFQSRLRPASGLYQPRSYDPMSGRRMLQQFGGGQDYAPFGFAGQLAVSRNAPLTAFWRTAEVDPVRPLSLTSGKDTRDKCVAIWKLNKARELARQAADAAAATVRKDTSGEIQIGNGAKQAAEDLRKPFAGTPAADRFQVYYQEPQFTVAKLLVGPNEGGNPPQLLPFNPTHRSMVYDTDKLRDELIAKKDAPLGTTFVVEDQPKTTLYLLVVAGRDEKGENLFRDYVLAPTSRQPADSPVLSAEALAPGYATFVADADRKTAVALLKAEFKYKDENPKLDEKRE